MSPVFVCFFCFSFLLGLRTFLFYLQHAIDGGFLDVAQFGSLEHELEQASDKLICITTIFRNLSVFELNHKALADPNVVRFLSGVIERLGTSKLLLRTNTNTLDFMNDIVIFLSNLSHLITLLSADKALNLLHLILAFIPWSPRLKHIVAWLQSAEVYWFVSFPYFL